MGRLIDADKLSADMYHEAFEKDSDMQKWDSGCWIRYKMFENVLKAQPTVKLGTNLAEVGTNLVSRQPEQRWIPVAEALPEEYGECLVTYKSDGDQMLMDIVEYEPSFEFDHEKNRFKGNWLFADDCRSVNPEVLAWIPLPEIYQEGGE